MDTKPPEMAKTFLLIYFSFMLVLNYYGWRMLQVEVKEPRNLVHERWCMEMVLGMRLGQFYSYDSYDKYLACTEDENL